MSRILSIFYTAGKDSNLTVLNNKDNIDTLIYLKCRCDETQYRMYGDILRDKIAEKQALLMNKPLLIFDNKETNNYSYENAFIKPIFEIFKRNLIRSKILIINHAKYQISEDNYKELKKIERKFGIKIILPLHKIKLKENLELIISKKIKAIIASVHMNKLPESIIGKPLDKYILKLINDNINNGDFETVTLETPLYNGYSIVPLSQKKLVYKRDIFLKITKFKIVKNKNVLSSRSNR